MTIKLTKHLKQMLNKPKKKEREILYESPADYMEQTSPKLTSTPPFVYHASSEDNMNSIMEKGILANPHYGEVYVCPSLDDIKVFASFYRVPHDSLVFKIDTKKLDMIRMRESIDHNRKILKADAYVYFKSIPPEAIVEIIKLGEDSK